MANMKELWNYLTEYQFENRQHITTQEQLDELILKFTDFAVCVFGPNFPQEQFAAIIANSQLYFNFQD